jgi:hypothetical protein
MAVLIRCYDVDDNGNQIDGMPLVEMQAKTSLSELQEVLRDVINHLQANHATCSVQQTGVGLKDPQP